MIKLIDLLAEAKENRISITKIETIVTKLAEVLSEAQKKALLETFAELAEKVEKINLIPYKISTGGAGATYDKIDEAIKDTAGSLSALAKLIESYGDDHSEHGDLLKAALKAINEIYEY